MGVAFNERILSLKSRQVKVKRIFEIRVSKIVEHRFVEQQSNLEASAEGELGLT